MNPLIALVGAGEYLPVMDEVDRYLLAHSSADGHAPRVVCLPTAAGQEGEASWGRWMRMGEEHFGKLGADVQALPVIDRASADDAQHAEMVAAADLIYFSGGHPMYLFETMDGSRVWEAAQQAWARGAVYAGCSAGAMIMAKFVPNIRTAGLNQIPAFGAVPAETILPHFDKMSIWRPMLLGLVQSRLKEGEFALGIDEDTALVGRDGGEWQVMGRQKVYVIRHKETDAYSAGQVVPLRH